MTLSRTQCKQLDSDTKVACDCTCGRKSKKTFNHALAKELKEHDGNSNKPS